MLLACHHTWESWALAEQHVGGRTRDKGPATYQGPGSEEKHVTWLTFHFSLETLPCPLTGCLISTTVRCSHKKFQHSDFYPTHPGPNFSFWAFKPVYTNVFWDSVKTMWLLSFCVFVNWDMLWLVFFRGQYLLFFAFVSGVKTINDHNIKNLGKPLKKQQCQWSIWEETLSKVQCQNLHASTIYWRIAGPRYRWPAWKNNLFRSPPCHQLGFGEEQYLLKVSQGNNSESIGWEPLVDWCD